LGTGVGLEACKANKVIINLIEREESKLLHTFQGAVYVLILIISQGQLLTSIVLSTQS
jgi:hypothetical protein